MLAGSEVQQRQAITAVLWGDTPFSDPLMRMTHLAGLEYELANDASVDAPGQPRAPAGAAVATPGRR
jgi:hypothetical protein